MHLEQLFSRFCLRFFHILTVFAECSHSVFHASQHHLVFATLPLFYTLRDFFLCAFLDCYFIHCVKKYTCQISIAGHHIQVLIPVAECSKCGAACTSDCLKHVCHSTGDSTTHDAVTVHWFHLIQVLGNACLHSISVYLFREFLFPF